MTHSNSSKQGYLAQWSASAYLISGHDLNRSLEYSVNADEAFTENATRIISEQSAARIQFG